jgi:signal peptidase I
MLELVQRYVKYAVALVLIWVVIWVVNNTGCRKIEGTEMAPAMDKDDFKIVLLGKRTPAELNHDDIVMINYKWTGRKEETLAGRIFGKPGDLIYVEKRILSPQLVHEGLEARREKPGGQDADRFIPVVVPRDTYFIVCDNKKEYSLYDSRGVGPVGFWAVAGKVRN